MRYRLPLTILLVVTHIISDPLSAQKLLDFDNYFFSELYSSDDNENKLQFPDVNTSWIDRAEIRTETDEFDIARQQYSFRLTPSSRKVNRAIDNLVDAYTDKYTVMTNSNYTMSIVSAYEAAVTNYKIESQSSLLSELLEVLQDQDIVYERLLNTKKSYAIDWLDIQKEISEIEVKIFENQKIRQLIVDSNNSIDWSSMIDVTSIRDNLTQINNSETAVPSTYSVEQHIIDSEIVLRKAESSTYFDFLQLDYNGPTIDPLRERLSVTAAFQLPIMDSKSKLKIAELQNKKTELELKQNNRLLRQNKELQDLYDEIIIMTDVYAMREITLKDMQTNSDNIIATYQAYNDPNPLFLLLQKEMIIKEQMDILKLKFEIIDTYLEYLNKKELLFNTPFKNYLLSESN